MKTPSEMTMKQRILIGLGIVLTVGCQQQSLTAKLDQYRSQSRATLEAYARGVSRSFKARRASRGLIGSTDFTVDTLHQGSVLNPNLHLDTFDCFERVEHIPASSENYIGMVAKFSQCLNRMLVEGNPLMSYGYRNLDPMAQQYYAYLLNWRRFGGLESFPSSDFSTLSQFAGAGNGSLGGSGFSMVPR